MQISDLIIELKIKLAGRAVVFFCSLGAKKLALFSLARMNRLAKARSAAVVSKMERTKGLV
jgi:hypothetical protein